MISPRRYLALDIRPGELRAITLRGRKDHPQLTGARLVALPGGVISPSLREPNIRDVGHLVRAIGELLHPLAAKEERVAVVLPETAGRLLLTTCESSFTTRAEGEQILKWQLKGQLPVDPSEVCLDFQVVERGEDGRVRLAVAVIAKRILQQYEEAVIAAGYHPEQIGFHASYLHNFYRTRIERGGESLLVAVESGWISFEYTQNHLPVYRRFRETGNDPTAIFQEVTRALVGAQEEYPGLRRADAFLQCDHPDPESVLGVLKAALQRDVVLLDPRLARSETLPSDLPAWRLRGLAAAVGAAEQLM